jgi:hypothetical protein
LVDPAPAIARVVTVLTNLGGMRVYTGVPESLAGGVNAYVTLNRWAVTHESGGQVRHDIDIGVTLGYRVANAEATVESALATKVGAFIAAFLPELRTQLGGVLGSGGSTDRPDFSISGEPEYALVAGQEYRLFRGRVPIMLRETF